MNISMLKIFVTVLLTVVFVEAQINYDGSRHEIIRSYFDTIPGRWRGFDQTDSSGAKNLVDTCIASIRPELLLDNSRLSSGQGSECIRDLEILIRAAAQRELWALKVFDAWGKPLPSGLLNGNIFWTGNYDECINPLYQEKNRSFVRQPVDTQYCALQSNPSQPVDVRSGLILGLCLPASCNRQTIVTLLQNISQLEDLTQNNLRCSNDRHNEQNSHWRGTIAFVVVLSFLILIVLIGTSVDVVAYIYLATKKSEPSDETSRKVEPLILARHSLTLLTEKGSVIMFLGEFSAIRTLRRILVVNETQNKNMFTFLNGLRVLSLFWVILGHSFSSGIYYASNILDMQTARRNIVVHLITSGALAVDTFFLMGGFLNAILFVRQVQKEELSPRLMGLYYIHRYLRLTPAFILTTLASVYLTPYFGHGPLYPIVQGFEPEKCRDGNWWTSFLYIGNFLKSDDLCLGITWYLHNDMQFHWIAPLALIPFVRGRKIIGYLVTVLFALVSIGSTIGLLLYYPSLLGSSTDIAANATGPIFFDKVYMAPWCRISPYAIGLLTGFLVNNTGRNYHLNRTVRLTGNLLATALALTCIFSNYGDFILPSGLSRASNIAYQALSRPAWSISIAWLIFLCSVNHGGIVNRILSSAYWSPFARLNYAAYLVHITVIFITVFNQSNPLYYQFMSCVNSFVSQLFFSYLAATVIVILFETPFFILEKKIFKR